MYLHIGGDFILSLNEIVAILDLEYTTIMRDSRDFVREAGQRGVVVPVSDDMPRSLIVTTHDNGSRIYLSPISCGTLRKRAEKILKIFRPGRNMKQRI